MKKSELIQLLVNQTKDHLSLVQTLKTKEKSKLEFKANDQSWSTLQCIEHLCRYADYYIPAINNVIINVKLGKKDSNFKSGWLGNYFAESMLPDSPKSKRMSTFKNMNPSDGIIRNDVLFAFEAQLNQLIDLLESSRKKEILNIRIPITLSKFIRIKTGDTFRFVINHHERHLRQALRASVG
jgi:hypothetical protein